MKRHPENDADQLELMLAAAQEALRLLNGHSRQAFDNDRILQLAVEKLVQNIGEAASNLSEQFKTEHEHIPWSKMTGMRHRLVHDFHAVDHEIVWDTGVNSLPELIADLDKILDEDFGS